MADLTTAHAAIDHTGLTGVGGAAAFVGVSLTKSAVQSVNSGTTTAITFDGEDFDTDAFHDNASNTSRITIPTGKGGKYLVTGIVAIDTISDAKLVLIAILKNGTAIGPRASYTTGLVQSVAFPFSAVVALAAGDYIELAVNHNNGSARDVRATSSGTTFQAAFLG